MNLLTETLEMMAAGGQTPDTVAWVGARDGTWSGSWDQFAGLAAFDYDDSYGTREVEDDLVVVFRDGSWLERQEYDGSEWWEYAQAPARGSAPLASQDLLRSDSVRRSLARG